MAVMELIEDQAARADLEAILEGITREYGLRMALDVAAAVRTAAAAGKIDGRRYRPCPCGDGACSHAHVCVVGHIALALDSYEDEESEVPVVPVWSYYHDGISPIEQHVATVRPGNTPATNSYLATLTHWLTEWEGARR